MRVLERLRSAVRFGNLRASEFVAQLRRAAPYLALFGVLELVGRLDAGRAVDAVGCTLLVAFVVLDLVRRPGALGQRAVAASRVLAERWLEPFQVDAGLDLRGTPPLPRRAPRAWAVAIVVSVALVVGVVLAARWLPAGAFAAVRDASGLAFLVLLSLTWGTLVLFALVAWGALFLWLRSEFDATHAGPWGALFRDLTPFVLGPAACWAAWHGRPAVASAWLGGILVLWALADVVAGGSRRRVFRDRDGSLAWTPLGLWTSAALTPPFALVVVVTSFATGGAANGGDWSTPMACTTLLGSFTAWSVAVVAATFQLVHLREFAADRAADPARGFRTRLWVAGLASRNERQLFQRTVAHFGFLARFAPARRRREEVPLHLTRGLPGATRPHDPWLQPTWPAEIAWNELEDDRLHARLRRRDEIQRRRHLVRGLRRAFREGLRGRRNASARPGGTWVAPHLWYFPSLLRDDDAPGSPWVGPAFRKVVPRSARAHLHRVLLALEVDVLYVEDGVDFRRLRRVLRMLFEYYDLFGRRPLEERHFTGLPGVRVVLHDLALDAPFTSDVYPEPEAEDLGRGRVLHVFRDRGGDEPALVVDPFQDFVPDRPVPV